MKYYGLKVYDIEDSIVASGFPMLKKKYTPIEYKFEVNNLKSVMRLYTKDVLIELAKLPKQDFPSNISEANLKAISHIKRMINLGNAKASSGHDCATKGILVNVNIEADQSFWLQWERYHHQDTISSMSTMHCLTKFDLKDNIFSKYTDQRIIDILNEKIEEYNTNPNVDNFHKVIHNCPEGIELCRRVSTNYLQLKTMYNQRKNHKMYSWSKDFVKMCDELPFFKEFCLGE